MIIVFLFRLRQLVCAIYNTAKVSDETFRGMPCMLLHFDVIPRDKGLTLEKFLFDVFAIIYSSAPRETLCCMCHRHSINE